MKNDRNNNPIQWDLLSLITSMRHEMLQAIQTVAIDIQSLRHEIDQLQALVSQSTGMAQVDYDQLTYYEQLRRHYEGDDD
jgi:hypothetical protein